MSELNPWFLAIAFSIVIMGIALFYLNTTSRKNSGDIITLLVKVGGVYLSVIAAFSGFIVAAAFD